MQKSFSKYFILSKEDVVYFPKTEKPFSKHSNTNLADLYAVDYIEVRLPIRNNDLAYLSLPESFRYGKRDTNFPEVTLTSTLGSADVWVGKVVRTEGAIDESSQQLYVVAQIDDPYDVTNKGNVAPIKIGQYVNAAIVGKTIKQALVIPNSSIYQGSYVYIAETINDQTVLKRKEISIRWQNGEEAIIESGLSVGDNLVLTPLGQVSSGTPVQIAGSNGLKNNRLDKQSRNANKDTENRKPRNRKKRNKEGKQ